MFSNDPRVPFCRKFKIFLVAHWRGIVTLLTPLVALPLILPYPPEEPYLITAFVLVWMAVYWMTECIPLAITSFLPLIMFPIANVMSTDQICKSYMNDTIIMFLGSLMLAYSIEQCGLHKRMAYAVIRMIGFSHIKILAAICTVTTFVSMWITNTAATTMMVPINFAILKVFDQYKICNMYESDKSGEKYASMIMATYFCATTYSATIGGIGTLVGTVTNLVFRGLFMTNFPDAPELLTFIKYSAFAIPYMLLMEIAMFFSIAVVQFGLFRPGSKAAKRAKITQKGANAARDAIKRESAAMGSMSCWECSVLILFSLAMLMFFLRSPQMFKGWGDIIGEKMGQDGKFIRDGTLVTFIVTLMFLFPSAMTIKRNCSANTYEELPKGKIRSILDWISLDKNMPWSFMFLLGGGFALSDCAKITKLNEKISKSLQFLGSMPNPVILLQLIVIVTLVTNLASNVAVANVFVPIVMQLAVNIKQNPLLYNIAAGVSASYCFLLPVGTPGNLIAQSAASIRTVDMIKIGAVPTITTILLTWLATWFWAPIIWPVIKELPEWAGGVITTTAAPPPGPPPPPEPPEE